ncbi:MAG: hypothetical protein VW683_02675 [Betaproteobacteria bacterium]
MKNPKHISWVHQFYCCVAAFSHSPCQGPIQAHHLLKPWSGNKRGIGYKASDENVVPLCLSHHMLLHDKIGNEFKFFEQITGQQNWGQEVAKTLWAISPERTQPIMKDETE